MTTTALAPRPRRLLPTFAGYRRQWLAPDIVGGISAGAVVRPQAMASATIANLPVQVGQGVVLHVAALPESAVPVARKTP